MELPGPLAIAIQSIHWHEQNAVIPCRSQEPPPLNFVSFEIIKQKGVNAPEMLRYVYSS